MDPVYPPATVNIYLPTYNPDPNHLKEAIRCVLAQTHAHWTLLIRDDHSLHDVNQTIHEFSEDPRIMFVQGEKNLGIGGSWNACLEHGDAPYIQYLFQDDLWSPTYLEKAVSAIQAQPSVGLIAVAHDYLFEGAIDARTKEIYVALQRLRQEHLRSNPMHGRELLQWWMERGLHPNIIGEPSFVMLRRDVVKNVGRFTEDMPQFLDADYWVRCLRVTDALFIPENLGSFRVHAKAASAQNRTSGAGIYDRLRCFEALIASLPRGPLKQSAIVARNKALDVMAAKFFKRMQNNENIPTSGSGKLKRFALQHPFLVAGAAWRGWRKRNDDL